MYIKHAAHLHFYPCPCRVTKGRSMYIQGPPNTGKSTMAKMCRICALVKGEGGTVKYPRETASFGLYHIDGSLCCSMSPSCMAYEVPLSFPLSESSSYTRRNLKEAQSSPSNNLVRHYPFSCSTNTTMPILAELCPVMDGDVKRMLAPRKGKKAVRINFKGHLFFASNETYAQLLYKKAKYRPHVMHDPCSSVITHPCPIPGPRDQPSLPECRCTT